MSPIIWFSIPLTACSLPGWLAGDDADLETKICTLEALAQLVLLVVQVREAAAADPMWDALPASLGVVFLVG